jgi:NitT/TauT family transport system substrate-binding protein
MRNMIIFLIGVLMAGQAMACGLCDGQEIRPSHAVQSGSGSRIGLVALKGDAKPVRIAYLQNDIHHLALWVALDQGFLIEGKDVQIAGIFRAGPEIMTAFAAGAVDMAYVGLAPTVTARANQAAAVVVVSQANSVGSALVVGIDSALEGVGALAGKTLAVPGHATVQDFLLKKTLKDHGVDLSQVKIMVLKPPEMIGALRTGQIDGFIAWEPYPSQAAALKVGRNLATSRQMWPDHPCCALVAASRLMETRPDQVRTLVAAHQRATDYIQQNPEHAVAVGVKHTGLDPETIRQAMRIVDYNYHLNVESVKTYVQFLSDLGYIRVTDTDGFIDALIQRDLVGESRRP